MARPALQALALVAACFATHAFGAVARGAGSLLVALAMALGGYRKGSLNPSGAKGLAVAAGALLACFGGTCAVCAGWLAARHAALPPAALAHICRR